MNKRIDEMSEAEHAYWEGRVDSAELVQIAGELAESVMRFAYSMVVCPFCQAMGIGKTAVHRPDCAVEKAKAVRGD